MNIYRFKMDMNKTICVAINSRTISFHIRKSFGDIGCLAWNNNLRGFRLEYHNDNDKMDLLAFLETIFGIQTKYDSYDIWITYEDYLNLLTFLKLKGE